MTGPIINPWWLYLYHVIGGISTVLEISLIFGIIVFFATALFLGLASVDGYDDVVDTMKKVAKRSAIVLACIVGAYIAVPSPDLLLKMFILDNVTYENLETVGGVTKEGFDYVMESIDELINKEISEEE